jgi:O-antigen/teichoic acid export membrane protein
VAIAAISVLSTPIYTRGLGVEGYGQYMLITALFSVYSNILSLGLQSGLVRSYGLASNEDARISIEKTCLTAALLLAGLNVVLAWALSYWAWLLLPLDSPEISARILLLVGLWSGLEVISMNCFTLLRLEYKSMAYTVGIVAKAIISVGAAYWMITYLGLGVEGAALAQAAGSLILALVLLIMYRRHLRKLQLSTGELREMLKFGLGLIPGNLGAWILSLSSRYVIQYYLGTGAVGLYSLASRIGSLVDVGVTTPFQLSWSVVLFPAAREGSIVELIKKTFTYYNAVACFFALMLGLFSKEIILLLGGQQYIGSEPVVFLVALGLVAAGWLNFLAVGFNLVNKTHYFSIIFCAAAALNLSLNVLLVPRWGIYAAAISTLVSYMLSSSVYLLASRRYLRVEIEVAKNTIVIGSAIVLYLISANGQASLWIRILLLFAYVVVLRACGLANPKSLHKLVQIVMDYLHHTRRGG